MRLNRKQTDGFAKIIKRGMEYYSTVPHSLGHFDTQNDSGVIGYVVWQDPEAGFITEKGDTNQEFYILVDGTVCVYKNKVFLPVSFKARSWKSFINPETVGSEVDED